LTAFFDSIIWDWKGYVGGALGLYFVVETGYRRLWVLVIL
jgi:hypothetical protein